MSRPDEGLIHQWLDGECTPEESARLEQLVATDPAWAAAVAEARGLIAASSRIVQSLDAVPRAMPAGSTAAPKVVAGPARLRFTVKPWMSLAAGLVLVAGTAFVLRERATEPFLPQATVDTPPPVLPDSYALSREEVSRMQPPVEVPPLGPVRTADRISTADAGVPAQSAPALVLQPPQVVSPPMASVPARRDATIEPPSGAAEKLLESPNSISTLTAERARAESRRAVAPRGDASILSGVVVTGTRSAAPSVPPSAPPPAPQYAPTAAAAPVMPALVLDGCWRVTAPQAVIGILERPQLRRQSGDTLVLITVAGDLTAIREGDVLRGGVQARRESCPSTP